MITKFPFVYGAEGPSGLFPFCLALWDSSQRRVPRRDGLLRGSHFAGSLPLTDPCSDGDLSLWPPAS